MLTIGGDLPLSRSLSILLRSTPAAVDRSDITRTKERKVRSLEATRLWRLKTSRTVDVGRMPWEKRRVGQVRGVKVGALKGQVMGGEGSSGAELGQVLLGTGDTGVREDMWIMPAMVAMVVLGGD